MCHIVCSFYLLQSMFFFLVLSLNLGKPNAHEKKRGKKEDWRTKKKNETN